MPHPLPTETIVARLRQGEEVDSITRYLYKAYERPLRGYIRRQGGTYDDASDLIQEVMLAFLHQVQTGQFEQRSDADLGSYFIGIARRKWLKKIEGENRRKERQYRFATGVDEPETPDMLVIEADFRSRAWERFQQLGDTCQKILTAYYYDKLSLEVITAQLGLGTVGAVKMRKLRCIQKLINRTDT